MLQVSRSSFCYVLSLVNPHQNISSYFLSNTIFTQCIKHLGLFNYFIILLKHYSLVTKSMSLSISLHVEPPLWAQCGGLLLPRALTAAGAASGDQLGKCHN